MKHPILALTLAFAAGCSTRTEPAGPAGPPAATGPLKISGPFAQENLAVYIIEDPGAKAGEELITLSEGLASGSVKVTEKKSAEVNELLIENTSEKACFVQAGDVVKGGQQDRAIGRDFVIPPKTGPTPVSSFCVEHSRWNGHASFGASTQNAYGNGLKLAIQKDANQQQVWDNVAKSKGDLRSNLKTPSPASSSSLNEELDLPKVQEKLKAFRGALGELLKGRTQAIGLITAINGKFSAADLYDDPGLFRRIYPRLLESAAMESLAAKPEARPAPPAEAASAFLVEADKGKSRDEEIRKGLNLRTCENEKGVQFDYSWEGRRVHRQALLY
jgi:hypothetical protein